MGEFAPDVWEQLEPQHSDFGLRVDSITHEDLWNILGDVGINEVDSLKLDCEGAEYLIVSELSALGLTARIGRIRGEWHSRKDNRCWQSALDRNTPSKSFESAARNRALHRPSVVN